VYLVVHQPRRLKLPARPIPVGASAEEIEQALFDEPLNERYFRRSTRRSV
jgi:alpha-amylase